MDCPRCGLINPDSAQRCDCGYDFITKKVEKPYEEQGLPKEIKTWLIIVIVVNLIFIIRSLLSDDLMTIVEIVIWSAIICFLYSQLVKRKNWARIALVILSFPIGLILGLSREAKLYCLQSEK